MSILRWLGRLLHREPLPVAVPTLPLPTPIATPTPLLHLLMGASRFCRWLTKAPEWQAVPGIQCPAQFPWETFQTDDRKMALGEYDENDPAVMTQMLEWMKQGGINHVSYQVEHAHEHTQPAKLPSWRKRIASPLTMGQSAELHPADSEIKYFISLWDVMAGDEIWKEMTFAGSETEPAYGNGTGPWTLVEVEESWRQFGKVLARHALKPSYMTIAGRPVFQRGWAHSLPFYDYTFGVTPARIAEILREEVRATTGKELYIISTCTEESAWPLHKEWGFNAVTQYSLMVDGAWSNTLDAHRTWWAKGIAFAKASGLDFWVPTMCGYDSRAWGQPEKVIAMPTPAEFTALIKEARAFALDNYQYTKGIVHTYAWDEIGEGGVLQPMADVPGNLHRGDEMLRAHKAGCI